MSRISAVNIPVKLNTRGVDRGTRETEDKIKRMQQRLKQSKGAIGELGLGGLGGIAGRAAAGSELFGRGGLAIGAGVGGAAAIFRLMSAVNDVALEAQRAMEQVTKGAATLSSLNRTALAPQAAANAVSGLPRFFTAFGETVASHGTARHAISGWPALGGGLGEWYAMMTEFVDGIARGELNIPGPRNSLSRLRAAGVVGGGPAYQGIQAAEELRDLRAQSERERLFSIRLPTW